MRLAIPGDSVLFPFIIAHPMAALLANRYVSDLPQGNMPSVTGILVMVRFPEDAKRYLVSFSRIALSKRGRIDKPSD